MNLTGVSGDRRSLSARPRGFSVVQETVGKIRPAAHRQATFQAGALLPGQPRPGHTLFIVQGSDPDRHDGAAVPLPSAANDRRAEDQQGSMSLFFYRPRAGPALNSAQPQLGLPMFDAAFRCPHRERASPRVAALVRPFGFSVDGRTLAEESLMRRFTSGTVRPAQAPVTGVTRMRYTQMTSHFGTRYRLATDALRRPY